MSTLEELRSALAEGEEGRAITLASKALDDLAARNATEERFDELSLAIRERASDGSEATAAAEDYDEQTLRAGMARFGVIQSVTSFAEGDAEAGAVLENVDGALEVEQSLDGAIDGLLAAREDVSVPPLLAVNAPERIEVPKGTRVSETVTVTNFGTQAATDIAVELETDLALEASPTSFAEIAPDEETTVSLGGRLTTAGRSTVTVTATAEGTADLTTTSVVVAAKRDYLAAALAQLRDLESTLEEYRDDGTRKGSDSRKGNGGSSLAGLAAKLESVIEKVERADRRLANGRPNERSADNHVGAAIDQLGAFRNQADALEGDSLEPREAAILDTDATAAVTTLERAQAAAV